MTVVKFNNPEDDYKDTVAKINSCVKENTVVLVWALWCPHCINMKNDWEKLSKSSKNKVNFVEIESTNLEKIKMQNKMLFKKLYPNPERVFFPMIKVWQDKKSHVYEDERTYEKMKQHIDKKFSKPKKVLDKKSKKQKGGSDIKKFQNELDTYIKQILSTYH